MYTYIWNHIYKIIQISLALSLSVGLTVSLSVSVSVSLPIYKYIYIQREIEIEWDREGGEGARVCEKEIDEGINFHNCPNKGIPKLIPSLSI